MIPPEALSLSTNEHPMRILPGRLARACEAAIGNGDLSRAQAAAAIARHAGGPVTPSEAVPALIMQPWELIELSRAGVLEPIARAVPTYMSAKTRDEMSSYWAMAGRQNDIRHQLTELRELVGERLRQNIWTALPRFQSTRKNDRLQPHVHCMIEILDAVNAGVSTASVWIEDRAFSRSRMPRLVNISDISRHLLQATHIDGQRYWSIDQQLREMGHAFMPIEVGQIANDVHAAPIVDGLLVETPELSKWRRWYAQEVSRLGFANQATEPDEDGRIAGEPRYLIDMMATARNVLAAIWSDLSESDQDKRARSDWAWTCLRFETSPAVQWSVASDEGRRRLMGTALLHTADLPLMANLRTEPLPKEAHKPFMDWFVQSVLDSRCAVDPTLGESFALNSPR